MICKQKIVLSFDITAVEIFWRWLWFPPPSSPHSNFLWAANLSQRPLWPIFRVALIAGYTVNYMFVWRETVNPRYNFNLQIQFQLIRFSSHSVMFLMVDGASMKVHSPESWAIHTLVTYMMDGLRDRSRYAVAVQAYTMYTGEESAPLDMKGCICQLKKWQIHPFISEGTYWCVLILQCKQQKQTYIVISNQQHYLISMWISLIHIIL